jgi:hypothetical protein
MQVRNESSVLFSLKELRGIEQQRVADERAAIERAKQAEIDAKLAMERAKQQAEEAKLAAEREERMRIENARIAAERELRLKVEATEATERARLAAELEQQRFVQEMELRRAEALQKRPRWMIAVTALAATAAVALAVFAVDRMREADAAQGITKIAIDDKIAAKQKAAEAQAKLDEMRTQLAALDATVESATKRLEIAQSEADRLKAREALAQARKEKADAQRKLEEWNAAQEKKIRDGGIDLTKCANGGSLDCLRGKH